MNSGLCGRLLAVCLVSTGIAIVTVAAPLRAADPMNARAVDTLILSLMTEYHVPGAALALINDGRVGLEKGYGFRDLDTRAPVTAGTLFNIGAISKSFTALGIAQLVDRHQVDLDTPVVKYVPELRLSDPRAAQSVTLRQLLSHTSGLPADDEWPRQVPPTREDIVREFATMPITAQPGTRFQYCSRCVVLAAYVLERITGQSWERYTRTQIFEPLGMTTAAFGPVGLEQASDRARPYRDEGEAGGISVPWARLQYLGPLAPAGGIDASIADMARYALLQLGDETASARRVVSAEMMAELHRPEIAVGAGWARPDLQSVHYALGWFTANYRGMPVLYHNGANPGFRAAIVLAPLAKAGVVILSNGQADGFAYATAPRLLEQLLR
ncbi:MAG TPA: serine hydrolase domain-containing protein [Rhizobiaceae bacterium]|nr:serine hydrolase domain-containing protein [Rhizobiaceae bacterium]